jgi:hypothetical protein
MAQQTAVEWLWNAIIHVEAPMYSEILAKAKEMELYQKQSALKLIEAQNQYIALLGKEIDSAVSIAHVHGWRSNLVEEGENMRNEINRLQNETYGK